MFGYAEKISVPIVEMDTIIRNEIKMQKCLVEAISVIEELQDRLSAAEEQLGNKFAQEMETEEPEYAKETEYIEEENE